MLAMLHLYLKLCYPDAAESSYTELRYCKVTLVAWFVWYVSSNLLIPIRVPTKNGLLTKASPNGRGNVPGLRIEINRVAFRRFVS